MRGAVAVSGELPGLFWAQQEEQRGPGAVCVLIVPSVKDMALQSCFGLGVASGNHLGP